MKATAPPSLGELTLAILLATCHLTCHLPMIILPPLGGKFPTENSLNIRTVPTLASHLGQACEFHAGHLSLIVLTSGSFGSV